MESVNEDQNLKVNENKIDAMSRRLMRDISGCKRWPKRVLKSISRFFRRQGPRPEVYQYWLVASLLFEMAAHDRDFMDKARNIPVLSTIKAYLDLAKYERDFARAWSYVNLSFVFLSMLEGGELKNQINSILRHQFLKKPLIKDLDRIKDELEKLSTDPQVIASLEKVIKYVDEKSDKNASAAQPKKPEDKLICDLLSGAGYWNHYNLGRSLKVLLWKAMGHSLLIGLALSIGVAIVRPYYVHTLGFLDYFSVALLGFFGGGLSAFITAREVVVSIPDWVVIKTHSLLRMIIGAAGSFVVFVTINFMPPIPSLFGKGGVMKYSAFLVVGITAGFSERLFVNVLEKISSNLTIGTSKPSPTSKEQK